MSETVIMTKENPNSIPQEQQESGFLNIQFFLREFLLNWQWIILSIFICLGIALLYVRYTPSVFQVSAKILVKEDNGQNLRAQNAIQGAVNLGFMNNTDGFDNELEILKSLTLAEGVVNDLKLYVDYTTEGRIIDQTIYKTTPVVVDMEKKYLDNLQSPISMKITHEDNTYNIEGTYYSPNSKGKTTFRRNGSLPMTIKLPVGVLTITCQSQYISKWNENRYITATITNPKQKAVEYCKSMDVSALSKTTTIATLTSNDINTERAIDYLKDLAIVYNRQANEDKNQIAVRTEYFINDRLEKLNVELGSTDGKIQEYKRSKNMVDMTANAGQAMANSNETDKKLTDMTTQIMLLQSVKDFMIKPSNKYQTLPSNVGLTDNAATRLIEQYNTVVLNRNRLLLTASELSPNVQECTAALDDLSASIKRAVDQAMTSLQIQRDALVRQYSKYSGIMSETPDQERFLTEIGRQQTVKEGLYLMLLQKREENSIQLAATADKGKLLDDPVFVGKVKPKTSMILLIAIILGIGIPYCILILLEMLRFRIEGHNDVEKLTTLPIIADVAVANDSGKGKADIVVHENKNNQMEEIFRGMRTNIQFMLKEKQNVIMFTSSTSGEGKTFVAANIAVSFALLGKKVLLIGLDIRRPRLTTLFEIQKKNVGICLLLAKNNPTIEDIRDNVQASGITPNLDLLVAGPVPPNPTELLSRESIDKVFSLLREEYDYVICDTAPVGLVTDTLQLSRVCDATVFVCRADYTEKSAFMLINDLAENNKVPNASIAINGIDMSRKKYGYAYGYGRYGKYGKYGKYGTYSKYGKSYGSYGYHSYGYGSYTNSHYSNPNDDSIKK